MNESTGTDKFVLGYDASILGRRRRLKRNAAAAPTVNKRRKKHRDPIHLSTERPIELNFERKIYKIYCNELPYHQDIQSSFERPQHREIWYPETQEQVSSNPQYNMSSQLPKSNSIEEVVQSLLTNGNNKETAGTSVSYLENILKSQSYLEEYMYWQHGQAKSITQQQYSKDKGTNLHPQQTFNRSDEQYHQVSHAQDVPVAPQSYSAGHTNPNLNRSYENPVQNYFLQDQYNRNTHYSYPYEQRRLESNHTSSSEPNFNITNEFSAPASIGHLRQNQHAPNMTVVRTTGGNPIDIQVNNYYKEDTRIPSSGQHYSNQENTHQGSKIFNSTAPNNCDNVCIYADKQYVGNQNNLINRPYIIATRRISSNRTPNKLPPKIVGRILEDPATGIQYIEQFPNINNNGAPLQDNSYEQNTPVEENQSFNISQHIQENQLPTSPHINYSQTPNFGIFAKSCINSQKPRHRRNIPQNVQPDENAPTLIHSTAAPEHLNENPLPSTIFNPIRETVQRPATMTLTSPNTNFQSLKDLLPPINVTLHNKCPKSLEELLTPLQNTSNPADNSCSCQCLHGKKPSVQNEHTYRLPPVVHNPHINKLEELVRRPGAQIGARKSLSSTATTTSMENKPFVIQSSNDQTCYIANINKDKEVAPIVVYSSDEDTLSIPETDMEKYEENNYPENNTDDGDTVLSRHPQFASSIKDEHFIQNNPETFTNQEICMQNTSTKEEIELDLPENPTEIQPMVDQNWAIVQSQERQEAEVVLKQKITGLYKKITSSILHTDKLYKEVYKASAKIDEAYKIVHKRMCDYLLSTNQGIASTSKHGSNNSNEEENNYSEKRYDEVIETHGEESDAEVVNTYDHDIKTEIIQTYEDECNAEVKESFDDESNVAFIKTYDDELNAGEIDTNNEEKPYVQPPEHSIGDTKWTLKHTEPSRNVVELVLNSGIFIDFSDLSRCKKDATDCETLAEMLLTSIFKEEALRDCSLTGDSTIDTNAKTRPGLDAKGRIALITFVDEYANEVGWPEFKLVQVIKRLQKKILDLRSDNQHVL